MSEKHKRRFWQFHLSTLIVMTFVGAIWLGVNFIPFTTELPERHHNVFVEKTAQGTVTGFPISWTRWKLNADKRDWVYTIVPWAVGLDGAIGFCIALTTGVILEKYLHETRRQ